MKRLTELWRVVASELATWCSTSTSRDFETVATRFENEGDGFLTITLPAFGKDFERCLDQGRVAPDSFVGFAYKGGLPRFLGGFLELVFDRKSGVLLDNPNIDSIFAIRQLTLMFKKILLPCSDARIADAMRKYVECEQEVQASDRSISKELLQEFKETSALLFWETFIRVDSDVYHNEVIPRHGPGATADRLSGNGKYDQIEWPQRLDDVFPYGEYAIPNWRYYYLLDRVRFLEPGEERPVKVIPVPKTLETPRIIAIEPTAMQYMQQALMERFVNLLEAERFPNGAVNPVSGMIGFTDQVPNQGLASLGSLSGDLATLDLSEASDRVSNLHVRTMLADHKWLTTAVQASRSLTADVPGEGVFTLSKFASMGSALCFPMEAMVFLTIIFMAIAKDSGHHLTTKRIQSYRGKVRVYGDDIIVPVENVQSVIEYLGLFGYKVNSSKSFWTGKFRESCGKEYYDGRDVSITRVRRLLPTRRSDVSEVASAVSLRNQLYFAGLWRSAAYMDELLWGILPHFPRVYPSSPVLGRHSVLPYDSERMSGHTHSPLVKGYVLKSNPPASLATGEGALLKCLLKRGDQPIADSRHLERHGRTDSVNIKIGWFSPF